MDAAAANGYGGVEYSAEPISRLILEKSAQAAQDLLATKRAKLGVFSLPVDFRTTEENFRKSVPVLKDHAAAAATVGCTRCVTWLNPSLDDDPVAFAFRATRRLRECAKMLRDQDINFGLEWVGTPSLRVRPDGTRARKHDFIYTLPQALEFIEAIGEPNVGLLVDSWHWYTARHTVEDLQKLPREKIIHVHVNDAPNKPIEEQLDNQRLLPGESGVIDLVGFLGAIKAKGYHGFIAVETFSETVPKLGLMRAAKAAKQALDAILKRL